MRSQVSSRACVLRHQPQLHYRSPGAAALAPHTPCKTEKIKAFSVMLMRSQVLYWAVQVLTLHMHAAVPLDFQTLARAETDQKNTGMSRLLIS